MSNREEMANAIYQAGLERVRTTPHPPEQKFKPGTFVMIARDLGSTMKHFESGLPARVEYTYKHAYGDGDAKEYSLLIREKPGQWSEVTWYYEDQLTEITDQKEIAQYEKELAK